MKSAQTVAMVLLCALAAVGFAQGWSVRSDVQSARLPQLQRTLADLRQPVDPALSDFWQAHPPQALPDQSAFSSFKAEVLPLQTTLLAQGWTQQVLPVRMHFQVENEAGFSGWLREVEAVSGAKRATSCVLERDAGIRGHCDWEWQTLQKGQP
jgi:hypothetical protein